MTLWLCWQLQVLYNDIIGRMGSCQFFVWFFFFCSALCNDALLIHNVTSPAWKTTSYVFEGIPFMSPLSHVLLVFLTDFVAPKVFDFLWASCAEVNWCSARLHGKTTLIGTWKPETLLDTNVQWEVDWELLRGPGARSEAKDWREISALSTFSQQRGELELFCSWFRVGEGEAVWCFCT